MIPPAGRGFTLTKWYMDCVTSDGRVAIVYWARIAWRRLALGWHSLTLWDTRGRAHRKSGPTRTRPPAVTAGVCRWRAPRIGCTLAATPLQSGVALRLFDDQAGYLDWSCEAPLADVVVEVAGHEPLRGTGYLERLTLTVAPWRLPIARLRWGRWAAAGSNRSMVWIAWEGRRPVSLAVVDGQVRAAIVTNDQVRCDAVTLRLDPGRVLEAGDLRGILGSVPRLRAMLPPAFLALHQTRWLAPGALRDGAPGELTGQALHEVVVFR
jgi:hypothetical protein